MLYNNCYQKIYKDLSNYTRIFLESLNKGGYMKNILNKYRKVVLGLLIFILLGIGVYRAVNAPKEVKRTNYMMGTVVNLTLYTKDDTLFEECFNIVRDIENKMSLNIEGSEINNINKNAFNKPVRLSDDMYNVISKSIEYSKMSNGKFDITAGKLVELWNIGSSKARVPSQEEIDNAIEFVDYNDIVLDDEEKTISLKKDGMVLDLGGIAKGYAADRIKEHLKSRGVEKAIIDLGGNIYVVGSNPSNKPWGIGIQNPFTENRNEYLGSVSETNKSIVTSGVYERYYEEDGKKYHHILDTETGYPVENNLMGVSIVSKNSIDGDALSTSVFAMGLEDGMKLINSMDDVDAIFITKDKKVYLSDNIKKNFKAHESNFSIAN